MPVCLSQLFLNDFWIVKYFFFIVLIIGLISCREKNEAPSYKIGDQIDSLNHVVVYFNGDEHNNSQGASYINDYYCGQKGQCVEFAKRYYKQVYNHEMTSPWGHAINFFNKTCHQGKLNPDRGLLQFKNGGDEAPKVGDLIVFEHRKHGHVAIVSDINWRTIEVIQQNMDYTPRENYKYTETDTSFTIHEGTRKPVCWLRKP